MHFGSGGPTLNGYWTAFGLTSPGGTVADFTSFPGGVNRANSQAVGTFANGQQSRFLDSSESTLCYLTKIQGQFDGRGEWIRIDQGTQSGQWYLRARGACKKGPNLKAGGCEFEDWKRVEGEAECYHFDQSN
jgi:hypothetical protein